MKSGMIPAMSLALATQVLAGPVNATPVEERDPLVTVTTATTTERELNDTPHAVTIVDSQQIREATAHSTPDLLERVAGVYIQKTNQGGGSAFIRGLTGKQMLILIDGVRLNNSFYRFGPHQYLNTIDSSIIERIEVVRGPASVLYGTDALGGVVNIITRRRTDFRQAEDVDAEFNLKLDSAVDGGSVSVLAEGNRGETGWLAALSYKDIDDLDQGDGGEQVPSAYEEAAGFAKLQGRGPGNSNWTLASHYLRQWDVPKTSEVTLGSKLQFNYEPQKLSFTYLEFAARDLGWADRASLTFSLNYQAEGEQIIDVATPNTETQELTEILTPGVQLRFTSLAAESHRLTYGVDYFRDRYDTDKKSINLATGVVTPVAAGVPDDAFYETRRAYLQDEFQATADLQLVGGLSYNYFRTKGSVTGTSLALSTSKLTGSLHALYQATPGLALVGGYAQGFRAPNMEDFFGRVDFATEIPNTNLKPESSSMLEIGFKYLRGRYYAELFLHETRYRDLITRVTVAPGVQQRQNADRALIRGAELLFTVDLNERWRSGMSATWTWGQDRDSNAPLRRIPPLNGSLFIRHELGESAWAKMELAWADDQERLSGGDVGDARIGPGGTPGYLVPNVEAGWVPWSGANVTVRLENLLDKQYKTHGSGIFAPGRSMVLRWRQEFGD